MSMDFESTSTTRNGEKPYAYATFNVGWAPLVDNDWHEVMQKMTKKLDKKQHRKFSMLDHGLTSCSLEVK